MDQSPLLNWSTMMASAVVITAAVRGRRHHCRRHRRHRRHRRQAIAANNASNAASTDIPSIDIVWWPQPPQFLSLPLLVDCCLSRPCQRRHVVVLAAVTVAVAVDVVILIVLPIVITIAGFS